MSIVQVSHFSKYYGNLKAVDDLSFEIEEREIFGMLGPNGAGKTTTVETLEGLRKPDAGEIFIDGHSVLTNPDAIKPIIGVQLQANAFYPKMKVEEAINLFRRYYPKSLPAEQILELVSLIEKRRAQVEDLSGGQQQRLAFGLALVNDPKILFLDEPTTGLDPQARRKTWELIQKFRETGKTILLTTHYMEEAQQLCDRVLIIDHGKKLALDSPQSLITKEAGDRHIEFTLTEQVPQEKFRTLPYISKMWRNGNRFIFQTDVPDKLVVALIRYADEQNIEIRDLHIQRPTLEDVFISYTGRTLRE
ncbi:MAG TPA: ABC transporter ATP-binding protein [Bacteroidetes bacterium]|nr:ABC transporter ATP-binding protein [Bacteroidota bacterium]